MSRNRVSPITGVPTGALIVRVAVCVVLNHSFATDKSGVRVEAVVEESVRICIRLFERVLVLEIDGMTTPSTAKTPAALLERVVSEASPSSIVVPMVADVPMFRALSALIPPDVLIAPVVELVVSSVDGMNTEALAPVPPSVRSVVAPARAVKEAVGVVILVVIAGEVID